MDVGERLGRIETCLSAINEKLDDNNKECDKKVDRDIYDIYLKSETRRISDVESKTDRAWEELTKLDNKVNGLMSLKRKLDTLAYASLGTLLTIMAIIGYAAYYLIEPLLHKK